jgi:hypothetical protein
MTNTENTQKPPITDLWLAVDEEQTLRFGMRQAWRWAMAQQPVQRPPREQERVQACCGA